MFKLIKRLSTREWIYCGISLLFIIAQVYLDLKIPDYMNAITRISTGQMAGKNTNDILGQGALMLSCALGSLGCSVFTGYFVARVGANFSARLRDDIYKKVQSFSLAETSRFSNSSLITRATNDVSHIQSVITMGLQMLIKAPITAIWAILKITGKQWQWSLATAVAVIFMLLGITVILSLVYKKFKKIQTLTDDINQSTRDNLSGVKVVRAYNAEKYQESKFENINKEITKTSLFTHRTMGALSPVMSMVMNGLSLAIYWIGAIIISKASMAEIGNLYADMVVFISYGMQVISSFMMLAFMFMVAPRALVSSNRINEVLDTNSSIVPGEGVGKTEEKGTVEFENVSFRYPDANEDVLSGINFKVNSGETVAIIGATGCGKTSIVNLIPRFYDVSYGKVLVDGHNVKDYTKKELTKKIGYVSQKAILFKGTVKDNISFGDNESNSDTLKKALQVSQSEDFVLSKKGKELESVSQMGKNFSGGQKQRLSIARAIARKAELYIFDDTFSALDYKTDKKLRTALKKETDGATCIIVAQRIGTIKNADNIIVVDNGRIVGMGKHKELLENCPTYIDIAKSQLSEEELKNE